MRYGIMEGFFFIDRAAGAEERFDVNTMLNL